MIKFDLSSFSEGLKNMYTRTNLSELCRLKDNLDYLVHIKQPTEKDFEKYTTALLFIEAMNWDKYWIPGE